MIDPQAPLRLYLTRMSTCAIIMHPSLVYSGFLRAVEIYSYRLTGKAPSSLHTPPHTQLLMDHTPSVITSHWACNIFTPTKLHQTWSWSVTNCVWASHPFKGKLIKTGWTLRSNKCVCVCEALQTITVHHTQTQLANTYAVLAVTTQHCVFLLLSSKSF